jgi:hypothetical protein
MRLPCRPKAVFDSEVNLHVAAGEPAPAANGQLWRLWQLDHTEDAAIEHSSTILFACRHSELDVINGDEGSRQPVRFTAAMVTAGDADVFGRRCARLSGSAPGKLPVVAFES